MAANFKTFVKILPEKADNWRNYCICIACRDVNGCLNALLQKFSFKTERVRNHLKKCQHFKNKYPEIFFELFASETKRMEINEFDENIVSSKRLRRESTGSVHSAITSISLRSSNNSSIDTLDSFITKPLATQLFIKSEQAIFEKLMIQATVSAGFPLRWVKNKKVQELFHFLNPALILPGCKTLGGRILNDESKILENEMTKKLMNDSVDVTLTLMVGLIHRLRLKYMHITFLSYFAYQMNLFVGKIFKESEKFKQASIKAIKIALYFKLSLHKYFIGQLQTLQKESYGKYVQIAIGNDTRWNSYYECSKFESSEQSTSHQSSDNILYLPDNISSILLDETWWQLLSELVKYLSPD
ncbi:unnamed protein product [Rhizophagus irregularis]|nr:unnamed protein product [Rhizophagus irregularis]